MFCCLELIFYDHVSMYNLYFTCSFIVYTVHVPDGSELAAALKSPKT